MDLLNQVKIFNNIWQNSLKYQTQNHFETCFHLYNSLSLSMVTHFIKNYIEVKNVERYVSGISFLLWARVWVQIFHGAQAQNIWELSVIDFYFVKRCDTPHLRLHCIMHTLILKESEDCEDLTSLTLSRIARVNNYFIYALEIFNHSSKHKEEEVSWKENNFCNFRGSNCV